jgi:two-component system, chemotaxis family, protein-glutamate methylesterase/glutaminase
MSGRSQKTRVLIVDDSVVMRRLLSEAVASDPDLEVAGYAANGQIALALMDQVAPDIMTLDVEMPVMNGLVTLEAMRAAGRRLPVIMVSTLTERGAEATIDSLALGASDYIAKPSGLGNYSAARDHLSQSLLPKIKALCSRPIPKQPAELSPVLSCPASERRRLVPIEVLAVGSSTGGPNALAQVLPAIPGDFSAPVLIVQHMPATFTRFLAQRLNSLCQLTVEEAEDGSLLQPGHMWVAPGGRHLIVSRDEGQVRLRVTGDPPENSCRPSVDVLFRSVAEVFGSRVLALVLTGMGQDGLRGCERLAGAGAEIVVQDEATSVVWGMPGFVARGGLADAVLPLPEIAEYIVRREAARRSLTGRSTRWAAGAR